MLLNVNSQVINVLARIQSCIKHELPCKKAEDICWKESLTVDRKKIDDAYLLKQDE